MQSLTLSQRLMLSVLLPIILVFAALIALVTLQMNKDLPALHKELMTKEVQARSAEISRWLTGYQQWVWSLAQSQELSSGDLSREEILDWLQRHALKDKALFSLIFIRQDGQGTTSAGKSVDLSSRDYFNKIMAGSASVISDPVPAKSTGEPVSVVSAPIKRGGKVVGVLSAAITMEELSTIANQLSKTKEDYGWVVNSQGLLIAHPSAESRMNRNISSGDKEGYQGLTAASRNVLSGSAGNSAFTNPAGTEFFMTYAPVKASPGWVIGVSVPKAVFTAQTDALLTKTVTLMLIGLAILAIVLAFISAQMAKPVKTMVSMLHNIAEGEGDLTQRLPVHGKDEISQLADGFNRFTDRIHKLMIDIADITRTLKNTASELQSGSNTMRDNVHRQQSEVDQIATAMNEMESTVREVASHAQAASAAAQEGNAQAQEGSLRVGRVREVIAEQAEMIRTSAEEVATLQESGNQIGQVMTVIRAIAEQTNLLALNAAIEAARAGDAGRGFAVVSDEVRQLAGRTHESTQQIQQTVEALQERITKAVNAMHASNERSQHSVAEAQAAHEALQAITSAISNIDGMNLQIATATEEQSATTAELNRNLGGIVEVSNGTLQHTANASSSIENLFAQAELLHQSVGRFKL